MKIGVFYAELSDLKGINFFEVYNYASWSIVENIQWQASG
jgi:hypothetical protein